MWNVAPQGDEVGVLRNQIQDLQSINQQLQNDVNSLISFLNNTNKLIDGKDQVINHLQSEINFLKHAFSKSHFLLSY